MRSKADALVGDLAQLAEREDLEAARVSQHGTVPADKAVQSAHALDRLVAGAKIEMVGIAEDDLSAEIFEGSLGNSLDSAGRADGHEDRRFDGLVGQLKLSAAAAFQGGMDLVEGEGHGVILTAPVGNTL